MKLLKYFCVFCTYRIIWNLFRGHGQRRAVAVPCEQHHEGGTLFGFLLGLFCAPFLYMAALAMIGLWIR